MIHYRILKNHCIEFTLLPIYHTQKYQVYLYIISYIYYLNIVIIIKFMYNYVYIHIL